MLGPYVFLSAYAITVGFCMNFGCNLYFVLVVLVFCELFCYICCSLHPPFGYENGSCFFCLWDFFDCGCFSFLIDLLVILKSSLRT